MDEAHRTAWLQRRAGFGLGPGSDAASILDPGDAVAPETWDADLLAARDEQGRPRREAFGHAIDGWLERMRTTPRVLEERMAWLWHGHFATSLDGVRSPVLMVAHVRLLQAHALGSFADLVRAITVDPAMLLWLDGAESVAGVPNENYGRELMELFTIGLGSYDEDDVRAAAAALTGWTIERGAGTSRFAPRRHDDTPQTLLGVAGVHDVDSVVDAVCSSPACAPFVARAVVRGLLGPLAAGDDELVGGLADGFAASGLQIGPLVQAVLAAGVEREDTAVVEAPVPWLVRAERSIGERLRPRERIAGLAAAGQVPMRPPDVGGWPDHHAWLGSSTVLARASMAGQLATLRAGAAPTEPDALAALVGRPDPFAPATVAAMEADPSSALALALCAPEEVVV